MPTSKNIIVDPIHGDIHLTPRERQVVDTATFQRLRRIKQLSMGHVTYPNATHTRFAHSLGVLSIMKRVIEVAKEKLELSEAQQENLCLAALLHDVGHYPYSHLMEGLDRVILTEDFVSGPPGTKREISATRPPFPDHEQLGEIIITSQDGILDAIGGQERAREIAGIFRRTEAADPQLSKLIHSSLDMDRLDYLLRDSRAAGVPYGRIDINYLLNSLAMSPGGMLGVHAKALPAAEQFLMARYFMYRAVYYHKTTVGLEEACRQMLRRVRDKALTDTSNGQPYGFPQDGNAIEAIAKSKEVLRFDDSFVDSVTQRAAADPDPVICSLAHAILNRRPPKLLKEVPVLYSEESKGSHLGIILKERCKRELPGLAERMGIRLGMFLFHETKPLRLEERGHRLTAEEWKKVPPESADPMIKVFVDGQEEPIPIVDVDHGMLRILAGRTFQFYRLYVMRNRALSEAQIEQLGLEVAGWAEAS